MYDMEPQNREQTTALSEEGSNGSDGKRNQPSSVLAPVEAPPRDRRKKPRIRETPPAPPPPPRLDGYEPLIGKAELDELRFLAQGLRGKTVKMVNSTAVGGGVAEILNRLVPLLSELEVATHWDVITGGNDFFEVTKAFHNALHGGAYQLTNDARVIFLLHNEQNRARPILTQISRFDSLKDPLGVIQAYQLAKKYVDCQLVLAGGSATDDPEGTVVLAEVMEAAGDDPDIIVLNLPPWSGLEINALQSASTIIIQKSLKEGFGLTVTEALWKGKPTIGSAVGGIPNQVIHKLTGALVHSVEGCAYQIRYLLTHPEFAEQLGKNGREHVKENFLITSNVKRWLLLFQIMMGIARQ